MATKSCFQSETILFQDGYGTGFVFYSPDTMRQTFQNNTTHKLWYISLFQDDFIFRVMVITGEG